MLLNEILNFKLCFNIYHSSDTLLGMIHPDLCHPSILIKQAFRANLEQHDTVTLKL